DRFPSMNALIAALQHAPRARRLARLRAVGLLAAVAATAAAIIVTGSLRGASSGPACVGLDRELHGVWDGDVRQRMRAAFDAVDLPYADDTLAKVEREFDDYRARWLEMRRAVCEADAALPARAAATPSRSAHCLTRRLGQFGSLTALLSDAPDRATIVHAMPAALILPAPNSCDDSLVAAGGQPWTDERYGPTELEALHRRLDRVAVLDSVGRFREGMEVDAQLLGELDGFSQTGYSPLAARARYRLAVLRARVGDLLGSERLLRALLPQAAAARDDELVARAWLSLITTVGPHGHRYTEAALLQLSATTAVARADDDRLRARLAETMGILWLRVGEHDKALAASREAAMIYETLFGPDDFRLATALTHIGGTLRSMGRFEEAESHYERAIAILGQALGVEHPLLAAPLAGLGRTRVHAGRPAAALAELKRARAVVERSLGSGDPALVEPLLGLGEALVALAKPAPAIHAFEQALALLGPPAGPRHAELRFALAQILAARTHDDPDARVRAVTLAEEARAIYATVGAKAQRAAVAQWLAQHQGATPSD
ncbi:MAG: tetratricopeptide repeat protein, partial [Myxococcota bacterium]